MKAKRQEQRGRTEKIAAELTRCIEEINHSDMHESVLEVFLEEYPLTGNEQINGIPVLHYAVQRTNPKVVEMILAHLQKKSDEEKYDAEEDPINQRDSYGKTALHYAVAGRFNKHKAIVKELLEKGALQLPDSEGKYPLELAASENTAALLEKLDLNAKNQDGSTLLHWLAEHTDEFQYSENLFLEKNADLFGLDTNAQTPIDLAITRKNYRFLNDAILFFLKKNLIESLEDILKKVRISPGTDEATYAVLYAAACGQLEVLQYLIEIGCSLKVTSKAGDNTLLLAAANGHLETVKYLVEIGCSLYVTNRNRDNAFLLAAKNGHLETVKYLIEKGCPLDATNHSEYNALLLAAKNGHLETVKYLVERGCPLDIKNYFGDNALLLTAANGHLETLKYLVEKKRCSLDATNYHGDNALSLAARNGQLETMKYLVEKKRCSLDTQGYMQMTPFDEAVNCQNIEIIQWLVIEKKYSPLHYYKEPTNNVLFPRKIFPLKFAIDNGKEESAKCLFFHHLNALLERGNSLKTVLTEATQFTNMATYLKPLLLSFYEEQLHCSIEENAIDNIDIILSLYPQTHKTEAYFFTTEHYEEKGLYKTALHLYKELLADIQISLDESAQKDKDESVFFITNMILTGLLKIHYDRDPLSGQRSAPMNQQQTNKDKQVIPGVDNKEEEKFDPTYRYNPQIINEQEIQAIPFTQDTLRQAVLANNEAFVAWLISEKRGVLKLIPNEETLKAANDLGNQELTALLRATANSAASELEELPSAALLVAVAGRSSPLHHSSARENTAVQAQEDNTLGAYAIA